MTAALHDFARELWRRRRLANVLLLPAAGLFYLGSQLRRLLYRCRLLGVWRAPVPVIVAGGITAGGGGKTTLAEALLLGLQQRGLHPGLVSRGYGRKGDAPLLVTAQTPVDLAGDEPALLARATRLPVAVGRDRPAAARLLLGHHPEVDVLVSDDGLQHLALARDIEIVVVGESYGLGNRWLLPAGPLREPVSRLATADYIVHKHGQPPPGQYGLELGEPELYDHRGERLALDRLAGKRCIAVAGVADPQGFFASVQEAGIATQAQVGMPDHHRYTREDLARHDADYLVMTAKDAIKCRELGDSRMVEMRRRPLLSAELLDAVSERVHRPAPA